MGERLKVYSRQWDSIATDAAADIIRAVAAANTVYAVVEEVTEVRVAEARYLERIDMDALEAVTIFWDDGEVVLRRRDGDSFCGSGVTEDLRRLESMPAGSRPDSEISAVSDDHVVRSIGTQRVEMPDGSCALYEARMGKPLRMPDSVCGDGGAQFFVRVYRDEFGRKVLSRFAALEGVSA